MDSNLIDQQALACFVEDDPDLLADLSIMFVRTFPQTMAHIGMAIEQKDPPALQENAHQLKSQLSYFFCESLMQQAVTLEDIGRRGTTQGASALTLDLHRNIEVLVQELAQLTDLELHIEWD